MLSFCAGDRTRNRELLAYLVALSDKQAVTFVTKCYFLLLFSGPESMLLRPEALLRRKRELLTSEKF